MTNTSSRGTVPLRDVLFEFSVVKEVPDAELLDEFVRRYPEYATALTDFAIDLVVEILRGEESVAVAVDTAKVSPAVSRAISTFQNALHAKRAGATEVGQAEALARSRDNPFVKLDRQGFRQLARVLSANLVFVCKLRDRQIALNSMTAGFLQFLAEKLDSAPEALASYFAEKPAVMLQPQFYKAETKPEAGQQQNFEEAVRSSGLTEEQQRFLLNL